MSKTVEKAKIAGFEFKVLGSLTPEEKIFLAEGPQRKQMADDLLLLATIQDLSKSKCITSMPVDQSCGDPEEDALALLYIDEEDRTPQQNAAIRMAQLRRSAAGEAPKVSKDPDVEFMSYFITSRAKETDWSYEQTMALLEDEKTEIFDFIKSEMGRKPAAVNPIESTESPLEPNLPDSEPSQATTPEMREITG